MTNRPADRAPRLEPDALIERLVPDAAEIPDVRVLVGFLGRSTRQRYWRLYLTPALNEYVEFAESDVVHSQPLRSDENRLGGTAIWIKREANVQHIQSASREAQADFLQGALAAKLLGRGRGGRVDPSVAGQQYVQVVTPMQADIFLSFAGHANSCVSDICNLMAPSFMSGGDVLCTFSC